MNGAKDTNDTSSSTSAALAATCEALESAVQALPQSNPTLMCPTAHRAGRDLRDPAHIPTGQTRPRRGDDVGCLDGKAILAHSTLLVGSELPAGCEREEEKVKVMNHAEDRFEEYALWEQQAASALRRKLRINRMIAEELAAEAVFRVVCRLLRDGARIDDIGAYIHVTALHLLQRLPAGRINTASLDDGHAEDAAQPREREAELRASSSQEDRGEFLAILANVLAPRDQEVLRAILQGYSIRGTAVQMGLLPEQVRRALRRIPKKARFLRAGRDHHVSLHT